MISTERKVSKKAVVTVLAWMTYFRAFSEECGVVLANKAPKRANL